MHSEYPNVLLHLQFRFRVVGLVLPIALLLRLFCVCQVKLASKRFLAGSLGLAAGVMLYVSLVEIFVKSQLAFEAHGYGTVSALTGVPC